MWLTDGHFKGHNDSHMKCNKERLNRWHNGNCTVCTQARYWHMPGTLKSIFCATMMDIFHGTADHFLRPLAGSLPRPFANVHLRLR